jgi:hypothetical protein
MQNNELSATRMSTESINEEDEERYFRRMPYQLRLDLVERELRKAQSWVGITLRRLIGVETDLAAWLAKDSRLVVLGRIAPLGAEQKPRTCE